MTTNPHSRYQQGQRDLRIEPQEQGWVRWFSNAKPGRPALLHLLNDGSWTLMGWRSERCPVSSLEELQRLLRKLAEEEHAKVRAHA